MDEVIFNRKAAIRNTVVYGIAFVFAIGVLITHRSVLGYVLAAILLLWAIGGLKANMRAIRNGFINPD